MAEPSSVQAGYELLRKRLRANRYAMRKLITWSALEAAPPLVSGLLVAAAIDRGFLAGRPDLGLVWLSALAAVHCLAAVATRRVYPWLAEIVEPLRDYLVTALVTATVRRAVAQLEPLDGASVAQATDQVDSVRNLAASVLRNARQFLTALVAVAGLALLSPLIAAVVAPMVALAVLGFLRVLRTLVARQREVVLTGELVTREAEPVIDAIRDVVACGAQGRAATSVAAAVHQNARAARAYALTRVARVLVLAVGVHLPLLTLLLLSPWLVARGSATAGVVAGAVVYLAHQLDPAMRFLVNAGSTWLVALGVALGRLAEVTRRDPVHPETGGALPVLARDIRVEGLRFAYSPHAAPVVDGVDFTIAHGTHLAVVGPSGVGKSTLADLITGITRPQGGRVLLGGVDIAEVADVVLRREIALIPQEAYVFAGTVRDNLTVLNPDATREEMELAAHAVGATALIDRLGGWDAEIRPGADALSAGERQLIALTRVWLSPARVVVLDEATCHLDPEAEARAEAAFQRRGGTLIVLAHRISSAMRAQRIMVMDGETAVVGTHEELLETSTLYADLVGYWRGATVPAPRNESSTPDGTAAGAVRP
ncbi:ATP-binding cassette subfamily C protein [Saccharopolyspora erythraea NRRL 2338]|uniref:ABC transporter ATP-binding protein n=2 Tax=Saccharopolyspora erythraea TaxID=1836 RepID=A0ABP3NIV7_SACER|nr:ABC transporter ATP-binding protein [Saccharopolyspora erythraea]PFG97003.1 ATP-binding cassette subfamily C protein [Saccharopolyspora erythraea NRRL 2338]QRK87217.1 ABC transporter ATP-binding protein [Saccharopolyspora erythraea]